MALAVGSIVCGRYTLERELGRGATATVWLAGDGETGDHVAMKVLHEDLAESGARERFLREARRTAVLEHERILRVLDTGEVERTLFFTQPYMPGGTLRERLKREAQLSLDETLRIGRAIADALAHAHAQAGGFVHRDVKPENILFCDGEAYLGDFGICRALEAGGDESSTSRLMVRGTAAYMSPEQASGVEEYDGRSDIFSLGAVLYECLAGVPAFVAATADAIITQVITVEPRDVRIFRPSVPDAVVEILRTCLEKRPADRFRDAAALASALASPDRRARSMPDPVRLEQEEREVARAEQVRRAQRRRLLAVAGILVLAISTGSIFVVNALGTAAASAGALDSTRLVLFPLERAARDTAPEQLDDAMLRDGFQRGEGISLVDRLTVADRLSQGAGARTRERLGAIARGLGAGRYLHGRLAWRDDGRSVLLALVDAANDSSLFEKEFAVSSQPERASMDYARAAATLLVRGSVPPAVDLERGHRWSIPALQAFAQGQAALEQWDLPVADSLFEVAQSYDAAAPRIQLWLAQVRAWARQPRMSWNELATRAASKSDSLPPRERRLALALAALGERRFAAACAHYDTLRRSEPLDHAAWFGLGQCRYNDDVVVRDTIGSPSGWRFRSSHQQAFDAFERALALLPSIHRGLQREGFDTKGIYFLRPTDIRFGRSEDRTRTFAARPALRGDTIAMIPYPIEMLAEGGPAVPDGFEAALGRQRESFARMAQGWSAAFPTWSEAKEAVALALELKGSPAALDTIRRARALARSAAARLALAATEVRLLVRFGLPDDLRALRQARALADSVLAAPQVNVALLGEDLEVLALLRGRCDAAQHFAASRPGMNSIDVPEAALIEGRQLLDRVALRCDAVGDARLLRDFAARLGPLVGENARSSRAHLLRSVLMRPVLMMSRRDSGLVELLASELDDPLVMAARALARGDRPGAQDALGRFDRLGHRALPMTPDYAFIAATLWVGAGDTHKATAILDQVLRLVRMSDPQVLREAGSVAALMRAVSLRVQLAETAGDGGTARRWQQAFDALMAR